MFEEELSKIVTFPCARRGSLDRTGKSGASLGYAAFSAQSGWLYCRTLPVATGFCSPIQPSFKASSGAVHENISSEPFVFDDSPQLQSQLQYWLSSHLLVEHDTLVMMCVDRRWFSCVPCFPRPTLPWTCTHFVVEAPVAEAYHLRRRSILHP